jgi:predicted anti-sigma-YlaC factor YlaD
MITPFINDKLGIKEMELFLDHITACKNCREELQFYYALLTAMKQLDEDRDLTGDYEQELNEKLERAQEKILHSKYVYYRKKAILMIAIIFLTFIVNLAYTGNNRRDKGNITVSNNQSQSAFTVRSIGIQNQIHYYLRGHAIIQIPMDE